MSSNAINQTTNNSILNVGNGDSSNAQQAASADTSDALERAEGARDAIAPAGQDQASAFVQEFANKTQLKIDTAEAERAIYQVFENEAQGRLDDVSSTLSQKQTEATTLKSKLGPGTKGEIIEDGRAQFTTKGGFTITTDVNKGGHTTTIADKEGAVLFRISGDPHVDVNGDGKATGTHLDDSSLWDFHYGDDSSVVLPDGAKVYLNSAKVGDPSKNIFFNNGIAVEDSGKTLFTGVNYDDDKSKIEKGIIDVSDTFDHTEHKIGESESSLVFGYHNNDAVIQNQETGDWHQLKDESWNNYLKDSSFDDQFGAKVDYSPQDDGAIAAQISNAEGEAQALLSQQSTIQTELDGFTQKKLEADVLVQAAIGDLSNVSTGENLPKDTQENRHQLEQDNHDLVLKNAELYSLMETNPHLFEDLPEAIDLANIDFYSQETLHHMKYTSMRKSGSNNIDKDRLNELAGDEINQFESSFQEIQTANERGFNANELVWAKLEVTDSSITNPANTKIVDGETVVINPADEVQVIKSPEGISTSADSEFGKEIGNFTDSVENAVNSLSAATSLDEADTVIEDLKAASNELLGQVATDENLVMDLNELLDVLGGTIDMDNISSNVVIQEAGS